MTPLDPALLAGSAAGSGSKPDPVRVEKLTQEAARAAQAAAQAAEGAMLFLSQRAAEEATKSIEAISGSVGELAGEAIRRGNLAAATAKKAVERLDTLATDEMNETRRAVANIGGELPILLEDLLAYKEVDEWELPALEFVIGPAVDQQLNAVTDGDEIDDRRIIGPPALGAPPGTLPPSLGGNLPPVEPPIPIPGLPVDPVPFNPPDEPEPEPPDPTVPPPPSEPDDRCCPPQQIIVPAPVVYVNVPGGGYVPVTPPPSPPPPAPPVPPGEPPPPPPPTPPEEEPPPPPPPEPPPPPPTDVPGLVFRSVEPVGSFDGPAVCNRLKATIVSAQFGQGEFKSPEIDSIFFRWVQEMANLPTIGPLVGGLAASFMGIGQGLSAAASAITSQFGLPNGGAAAAHLSLTAVSGLLDRWAGTDFGYYATPIVQAGKYANPLLMVSQEAADRMYLSSVIDREQWECITRSAGNMPWQHEQSVLASRTRPGIAELVRLRMRGWISEEEYYTRMRGEGVLTRSEAFDFLQLGIYIPPITDLMRWMVKDVANEEYVEFAGLDQDFATAWTPELDGLARANGVTPSQIKYEYRSQWQEIPLTQIYQMFYRLRPGRVPAAFAFTRENALQLMKIQEVPPGFRERILEVSFLPINRTDVLASHKAGTMSDAEVYERFLDLGYSPRDAQALQEMTIAKSRREAAQSMGAWTQRRIVKEYVGGAINRDEADKLLSRVISDAGIRRNALDDADLIRSASGKAKCIAGIKRRYMVGEFNENDARRRLTALSVDQDVIDSILGSWGCEISTRRKEPTIKMLLDWTSIGLIGEDELLRRLLNLGYARPDAERILLRGKYDDGNAKRKAAEQADDRRDKLRQRRRRDKKQAEEDAKPPKG